jgi:hypothetical protein
MGKKGDNTTPKITDQGVSNFMLVIRAVSWVESKHGTAGSNNPQQDPMQSGNPSDDWWKALTNSNKEAGDRIVRGPGLSNVYASALPDQPEIKTLGLTVPEHGHNDASFNARLSYYWGVIYLIDRINKANGATYRCGDCDLDTMIKAAVGYNGGRDRQYLPKLNAAVRLIEGEPATQP